MTPSLVTLHQWFDTLLGKTVASMLHEQWEALPKKPYYDNGLQLGTDKVILQEERQLILKKIHTMPGDVEGMPDALPFLEQSFSLVFLPFIFECLKDISSLLAEAERVLTTDGYLLVAGFNPFSWWGMAHFFRSKALWSHELHLRSSLYMYSMLASRGFHLRWIKSFFYRPPCVSRNLLQKMQFLEMAGRILWPYPGGLYLLLAQKENPQPLPVRPLWRAGGYVLGKA